MFSFLQRIIIDNRSRSVLIKIHVKIFELSIVSSEKWRPGVVTRGYVGSNPFYQRLFTPVQAGDKRLNRSLSDIDDTPAIP